MRYYSAKMEEAKPSSSSQPTEEGASDDVVVATEVQRTNRLLEIESMDWARQLKQAVSLAFLLLASPFCFPLESFPRLRIFIPLHSIGFQGWESVHLAS